MPKKKSLFLGYTGAAWLGLVLPQRAERLERAGAAACARLRLQTQQSRSAPCLDQSRPPRHRVFSRGLAADWSRAIEKSKRRWGWGGGGGFSHSIRLPLLICLRRELAGPVTAA